MIGCANKAVARELCHKHRNQTPIAIPNMNPAAAAAAAAEPAIPNPIPTPTPTIAPKDPDVTTGTPVQVTLADGSKQIAHILRRDKATGKYNVEYEDKTVIAPSTAIERGQLNLLSIELQYERQEMRRQIWL